MSRLLDDFLHVNVALLSTAMFAIIMINAGPHGVMAFTLSRHRPSSLSQKILSSPALLFSTTNHMTNNTSRNRFNSTAPSNTYTESQCLLTIHDKRFDLQAFAKAHPGGSAALMKYHDKDATMAFELAGHSEKARKMLEKYEVKVVKDATSNENSNREINASNHVKEVSAKPLWIRKLFTNEDPIGYHKYLGIFCLLHFVYRHFQIFCGANPTAGFGSAASKWVSLWLLPHGLLNASAFIFHTVPRERIVGSPMIWEEYRVHNLIFVLRSLVCTFFCHLSILQGHKAPWRNLALVGSVVSILASNYAADVTTKHLQPAKNDSSIASLPFWTDCSLQTQRRIKTFYAYCQFMATMGCLMVSNPAWPFIVMMPIQFSSILLTLVRKSIIGAKGWHLAYVASLMFPFLVGFKHFWMAKALGAWDVPLAFMTGSTLFGLRCRGVSKYWLWGVAGALRVVYGDRIIRYDLW